jgi:hypothetical protein
MADSRTLKRVLIAAAVVAVVVTAALLVLLFKFRPFQPATSLAPTAPLVSADFSLSNAVGCLLGGQEQGNGLELVAEEKDGLSKIVKVGGVPCRLTSQRKSPGLAGYLYFRVDPVFKQVGLGIVDIDVEYFDSVAEGAVTFFIQYDTTGSEQNRPYVTARPKVQLGASEMWQTATFHITNATFQNGQNGHSDFRLQADPPELYVRRVIVRRTGP